MNIVAITWEKSLQQKSWPRKRNPPTSQSSWQWQRLRRRRTWSSWSCGRWWWGARWGCTRWGWCPAASLFNSWGTRSKKVLLDSFETFQVRLPLQCFPLDPGWCWFALGKWEKFEYWQDHNWLSFMAVLLTWWSTGSDPWVQDSWGALAQAPQTLRSCPHTR